MTELRLSQGQGKMATFTLRWLFATTALFAVGFYGMMQSSQTALAIVATITLLMFLTSIVNALVRRDNFRSFHTGFSVWGIGYLVLIGLILEHENSNGGSLATTKSLVSAYGMVVKEDPASDQNPFEDLGGDLDDLFEDSNDENPFDDADEDLDDLFGSRSNSTEVLVGLRKQSIVMCTYGCLTTYSPDHDVFMKIGQLLWAWLFACIGGLLALSHLSKSQTGPGTN